jgi:hypothetical protein
MAFQIERYKMENTQVMHNRKLHSLTRLPLFYEVQMAAPFLDNFVGLHLG